MSSETTDDGRVQETCREWPEDADRCNERAEFILWGKLFPSEALGPRCYDHAAKHIGHAGMSRLDQWAVYDLRPVDALLARAVQAEQGRQQLIDAIEGFQPYEQHELRGHLRRRGLLPEDADAV